MRSCSTSPARRARRAGGAPSADWRGLGIPPRPRAPGGAETPRGRAGAFTFIAPRRPSCEPLTRARVRLLGPCFKTGRVGGRHRRRPRALASLGRRGRGTPGPDGATRPGRTGDSPPRPRRAGPARGPSPGAGWGGSGRGWESGRAVGGAARPPRTPARPRGGGPPRGGAPAGVGAGRGESAATVSAPSAPGCGERCCRGAVTLGRAGPRPGRAGPPRATFPAGLPSRPGAGRGAPPRRKCARRRPVAGRGAVPRRPHPRPRPPDPPHPPGGGGGEGGWRGREARGSGKDPPGRRHGRTRRRVESSGRTARTPPVYLLTVSRPLELSLQSSFQLSLTVLVDYRSRARI